jgi:hypothetical protein
MISGRIEYELAFLALLCTLSIFLFPAVQGPYAAVHGPVTTLQSIRVAARLRLSILAAALSVISGSLKFALVFLRGRHVCHSRIPSASLVSSTTILRC